ncbi:MAG TPA: hypothetical protein VGI73_04520 [Solirubrobacterales bacterium]|jgi:hypothetical protein
MIPLPPDPDHWCVVALESVAVLLAVLLAWRAVISTVRATWRFSDDWRQRQTQLGKEPEAEEAPVIATEPDSRADP